MGLVNPQQLTRTFEDSSEKGVQITELKINFAVGDLSLAGGNRTIIDLSNLCVELGHKVTITHLMTEAEYKWWTGPIKAEVINCGYKRSLKHRIRNRTRPYYHLRKLSDLLKKNIPDCDYNIATHCFTARPTFESKKGKMFYLVQHYEPLFFMYGSPHWREAVHSYTYRMKKLCVSHWLTEKLCCSSGGSAFIGNGINLDKFKRDRTIRKIQNSVMYSVRHADWKRADLLKQLPPLLSKFAILTTKENVTDEELVKRYNQAEIYVNVSRIEGFGLQPLEAMRCGCRVVSTPCAEYLNEFNCTLIPFNPTVEAIVNAVYDAQATDKTEEGYLTAERYNFNNVAERFLEAIQN